MRSREKILVSLPVEMQKLLLQPGREISNAAKKNFDEEIESALKVTYADRRDDLITSAILSDRSNSKESWCDHFCGAYAADGVESVHENRSQPVDFSSDGRHQLH